MRDAVREIRTGMSGNEHPIECFDIRARRTVDNDIRTPHYHEHIEFLYADRPCDVGVWVGGESVRFRTGDMLVINANVPHTFDNRLELSGYICIKVLPEMVYSSESAFFDLRYALPFFKNSIEGYQYFSGEEIGDGSVRESFCSCLSEWQSREYGYEVALKSHVMSIFLWTVRHRQQRFPTVETESVNHRLIQRSLDHINSNYTDVTESSAAAVAGMSSSHYSREFSRCVGRSFRDYLLLTRINAAEKLLLLTDMSVTEIALASGFATSSHFIERFKRLRGMTPSKYRQTWVKN